MKKLFKTLTSVLASALLAMLIITPLIVKGDVTSATAYLKTKQLNPWSIMALSASGNTPDVSSLQSANGTTAIEIEAPILALTSAGKDPRTFPSIDLVAKLKGFYDGTQIGDKGTLNDDAFGILALVSAGESLTSNAIIGTKQFLQANQNSDGGWGFTKGGASDTNTTASVGMALIASGVSTSEAQIMKATEYLKSAQNNDGGFPYDPKSSYGTDSDASSDAWVISFISAIGQSPSSWTKAGKTPTDNLLSLQAETGFFRYQAGSTEDSFSHATTAYAVVALLGKSYPVSKIVVSDGVRVHYRIEGSTAVVCEGDAITTNALALIKIAGDICGFTYEIKHLSFGDYLSKIGNDEATGNVGWLYAINDKTPDVGASDYKLLANDTVLWYFADFNWKLTRLSLSASEIASGATVTATVEAYEINVWKPLAGATVKAGVSEATTDANGKATLSLVDGSYAVAARKNDYVRSNTQKLIVGSKESQNMALSVTIVDSGAGAGDGSTNQNNRPIAFTVTPASLDFGKLSAGQFTVKSVTLTNTGSVKALFEATITGDMVFTDNIMVDGKSWRMFGVSATPSAVKISNVKLSIPANYQNTGVKSGSIVFWATTAP